MPPHVNTVACYPFSPSKLAEVMRSAAGMSGEPVTSQITYLGSYLSRLESKSMLVESHYVDRQFVEEYASYYSRCFLPIRNYCTRLHFFKHEVTDEALADLLEQAAEKGTDAVQNWLQQGYLGFAVVRPLPTTPVGRTVLGPFPKTSDRAYPPVVSYTVHMLGLKLDVEGVAFQQQDQAVAACATTAVWSALQRVCRNEGVRAPTTSEITAEAVRHHLPDGRPYPSEGLRPDQMSAALRAFQFPPDLLQVDPSPRFFMMQVHAYLRSGIPVVLGIDIGGEGHAVTAVGFSRNGVGSEVRQLPSEDLDGNLMQIDLRVRNLEYRQFYVHDDRMGPYARAQLDPGPGVGPFELAPPGGETHPAPRRHLEMRLEWPDGHWESTRVRVALVPLYPKLRTSAEELFDHSVSLAPYLDAWRDEGSPSLQLEVFFDRAGTYQASLYGGSVHPKRLMHLQQKLALSRYIGISRWYVGDRRYADIIWDTTDRLRDGATARSILGLVAYREDAATGLIALGNALGIPTA